MRRTYHCNRRRGPSIAMGGAALALALAAPAFAQHQTEVEPNGTPGTANPLSANPVRVTGNIYSGGDVDVYSLTVDGPARLYAGTMTSHSANSGFDTTLTVLDTDGTTVLETDLADGTFGSTSGCVANTLLPAAGTYFISVSGGTATAQVRGYDLYVRVLQGTPTAEDEPNDSSGTATPLPENGWVSGDTSSTTDADWFSFSMNAGDTMFVSLDADPERDNVQWNAQLGVSTFGGFILTINDATTGTATNPLSETHFMTARDSGTYFVRVNLPSGGTTFGTYTLSVSIIPAAPCPSGLSATHLSSDVPKTIGPDPASGVVTSTLTVPGNPRVGRVRVKLDITHALMVDLDVNLISPAGNEVALFNDIGNGTAGGPTSMNLVIDDEAGLPLGTYGVTDGMHFRTELAYRLDWFSGIDGGGTWTLVIRDDLAANGGTLNAWSLDICEEPLSTCPKGAEGTFTVFSTDFEADDGGFTHSGTQDEWEWGAPTFDPITSAYSGTNCWKTDLDSTYNASSDQNLFSPAIDLTNAQPPIYLRWAQKYQMESASFDHATVDISNVGGGNPRRLFEWLGATMTASVGNPATTIRLAHGWSIMEADISEYAGQMIQVRFHVDTDASVQHTGLAIDDFSVVACGGGPPPCPGDTDGNGAVDVDDLIAVILGWGPCANCPPQTCASDIDGNCATDVDDLIAVILGWGPCD